MKLKDECDKEAVANILACKSYYEILGVDANASSASIKQMYRQLALTFHPDKNKCPGAVEAFQAIGHAYEVLSDQERKKHYDRYGQDVRQTGSRSRHFHSQDHQDGDDDDEHCEEEANGRRQFYYSRRYGG